MVSRKTESERKNEYIFRIEKERKKERKKERIERERKKERKKERQSIINEF